MKTTQEKFEELIAILKLAYTVSCKNEKVATVQANGSDKVLRLELDNANTITVYAGEEVDQVLYLSDETSVGIRVLDIENVLIRYAQLKHGPLALSTYLYCTLLGILWGIKAAPKIKNLDPIPAGNTFVRLHGHLKNGAACWYDYRACTDGKIEVIFNWQFSEIPSQFSFYPIEYLMDPERIVLKFFNFFKDIEYIESVGKG